MVPGGNYGYTGTAVGDLTSFENTLATGLLDESGSTTAFARQMEMCVQEIIKSLRHCPRQDNLIYRHCHFDDKFREFHGFKPLVQCNETDYDGCWAGGGQTDLYGSEENVLLATLDYGQQQAAKRYLVNGIVYIISDGCHYLAGRKSKTQDDVKKALSDIVISEALESIMTILIGVNPDAGIRRDLEAHKDYIGFSQFVPIENADEKSLSKLANFISRSVVSQSQHLGSGGPSQSLTF